MDELEYRVALVLFGISLAILSASVLFEFPTLNSLLAVVILLLIAGMFLTVSMLNNRVTKKNGEAR